jgi:3,4-dihydroxy 2-butanone 4-phosphate synthase/GTP cyclohydrolase II
MHKPFHQPCFRNSAVRDRAFPARPFWNTVDVPSFFEIVMQQSKQPDDQAGPQTIERVAQARLPTVHGEFTAYAYRSAADGVEHLAVVAGELADGGPVLARVHSECLSGDVFGSLRCDCGPQLDAALEMIAKEGRGVVVYLRGHEGRGIGLANKIRAYALQDAGRDTVDANRDLGLPVDARRYEPAALILRDLGVSAVRLLSNNPRKVAALEDAGIAVAERIPLAIEPNIENRHYLHTKQIRLGHWLTIPALTELPLG